MDAHPFSGFLQHEQANLPKTIAMGNVSGCFKTNKMNTPSNDADDQAAKSDATGNYKTHTELIEQPASNKDQSQYIVPGGQTTTHGSDCISKDKPLLTDCTPLLNPGGGNRTRAGDYGGNQI